MDQLRKGAREALEKNPGKLPKDSFPFASTAREFELDQLWQDIVAQDHSTHRKVSCLFGINVQLANPVDLREPCPDDRLHQSLGLCIAQQCRPSIT